MITLEIIDISDASILKNMQEKAFSQLLEKYKDYDTSPVCESLERISEKISTFDFYYIKSGQTIVGAIRIVNKGCSCRLSPVFIMPMYRGRGYASQAMKTAEELYPDIHVWELDTIMQEEYLVKLYKKSGYVLTGESYDIKPGMTIVYMKKII